MFTVELAFTDQGLNNASGQAKDLQQYFYPCKRSLPVFAVPLPEMPEVDVPTVIGQELLQLLCDSPPSRHWRWRWSCGWGSPLIVSFAG